MGAGDAMCSGSYHRLLWMATDIGGSSPKAGAPELLPEVGAVHAHDPAHLVQSRAHAFTYTVAESFVTRRPRGRQRSRHRCRGFVGEICGDNGRAVVVVAGVEDE